MMAGRPPGPGEMVNGPPPPMLKVMVSKSVLPLAARMASARDTSPSAPLFAFRASADEKSTASTTSSSVVTTRLFEMSLTVTLMS